MKLRSTRHYFVWKLFIVVAPLLMAGCSASVENPASTSTATLPEATEASALIAATELPPPPTFTPDLIDSAVPLLTWGQLKNAEFTIPETLGGPEDGRVPFADGAFEFTIVPGSASVSQFLLFPGVAYGDLDGDNAEDALVVLINISPGSGTFYSLAPVRNVAGQPQPLDVVELGDRVIIEGVEVADGEAHVLFRTYRPDEPFAATPTLQVSHRYRLDGDTLQQIEETVLNAEAIVNEIEVATAIPLALSEDGAAVTVMGQSGPFELAEYTVPLTAGQTVTATVTAPHDDAFLSIYGQEAGGGLVSAQDELSTWHGVVPETQTYALNVVAISTATEFELVIESEPLVVDAATVDSAETPQPINTPAPQPAGNVVYLTFDDGPSPPHTNQILDLLARYDAKATFFVVGAQVESNAALLEAAHQAGHALANHTWAHQSLAGLPQSAFNQVVQDTNAAIGANATFCLRPPYGATDAFTRAYAAELGYDVIMWHIDTQDWSRPGSDAITSSILDRVFPGAIILMHDGGGDRTQTVAALEPILSGLRDRGYAMAAMCR